MERRVHIRALLALALLALAGVSRIAWQIGFDAETRFFSTRAPADWVTEATAPDTRARPATEREVRFERSFTLEQVPREARLRVRLHRAGTVLVNGRETGIEIASDENWKPEREREVTAFLRPGENEIAVLARASSGPAALWLVLEGAGVLVTSDARWLASAQGEAPRPVRLATTPMSAWSGTSVTADAPWQALREGLPWLVAFALASALALLGTGFLRELHARWWVAASALAYLALALHNRALDPNLGFDATAHLDYVRFILSERRLPLASDGWSMYHPPLYYSACAALFAAFGESVFAIRALNAGALAVQSASILGSLRILFPDQPRRVLAGFVLGAFVPMQLYLAQYVTNEVWTAAFSSAALWLCLRILARDDRSLRTHLALGALLAAALLTKMTALLVCGVVLAVLAARLVARGERSTRVWLRTVGSLALAVVVLAGWSYARVAWHFGSPMVGNWDVGTGPPWWQDPGYRTLGDYLRFGDSLTQPVFSACSGCLDGLYSTLFGDGLIGGMASVEHAPPWRYELMLVGYWLALLPAAGIAVGAGAALVRQLRNPRPEWLLALGVAALTAFALVSLSLRLPFYAQCKAFYGLSALLPLAAFGGLGLDLMAERLGRAAPVLWLWVGVWALCSYATYWAR